MNDLAARIGSAARFVAVAAGVVSALMAIGAVGGLLTPWLDVLSHFSPIWVALGLLAVVLGLAVRRRLAWAFGLVGILVAGFLMSPELIAARQAPRAPLPRRDLRVVQYNVFLRNDDPARTAAWILAQDADVVILEEAAGPGAEPILGPLRARYPFITPCPRPPCPTVILSRQPSLDSGETPGSPGDAHLSGAWGTYLGAHGAYIVVAAHLTWPIQADVQQAQIRQLERQVAALPRRRIIVAGDLNLTPWSASLRALDQTLALRRYSRALPSWPAEPYAPPSWPGIARLAPWNLPFPYMPIDHIYAGPGWTGVRVTRGPRLGSDHYPLVIDLSDLGAARR